MIWILGIVILAGVAVVVVLAALVGVFRLPVRTAFGIQDSSLGNIVASG